MPANSAPPVDTPRFARPPRALLGAIALATALFAAPDANANLDLAFLIDTTGSMGGEIAEAKKRIRDIVAALQAARAGETIRTAVVAYRDQGDDYVVKSSDFSTSVEKTYDFLSQLRAGGGGDGPEDVLTGLNVALHLDWNLEDKTERQVFLIADAPPHLDYENHPETDALIEIANQKRILVHTIGCRSLGPTGIDYFRQLSLETEGRYQHIGRVRVGDDNDLAAAIVAAAGGERSGVPTSRAKGLKKLKPKTESGPRTIEVTLDVSAASSTAQRRTAKATTKSKSASKSLKACRGLARVPVGLALAEPPEVAEVDGSVFVSLSLEPGAGAAVSFALPRCVSSTAPVHVQIGG